MEILHSSQMAFERMSYLIGNDQKLLRAFAPAGKYAIRQNPDPPNTYVTKLPNPNSDF